MLHKIRLTQESPSFQLVTTGYFNVLIPKRIESNQTVYGNGLAGLKILLMNDRYRFNQFSWFSQARNHFDLYDWLQTARSTEPLREVHFNRVVVSVEGVEWKQGLQILCELEYEEKAADT